MKMNRTNLTRSRRGQWLRIVPLTLLLAAPVLAQVQYEDIVKGSADNWLTYAGDYASLRHSPLKQIHRGNVGSLVPKWVYHVEGARKLETTPGPRRSLSAKDEYRMRDFLKR